MSSTVDKYYAAYLHWARNEAGIEASKVCIKGKDEKAEKDDDRQEFLENNHGHDDDDNDKVTDDGARSEQHHDEQPQRRGLYATDTIYPGERILFIPAWALLGDQMLRQLGQRALRARLSQQQQKQPGEEEDDDDEEPQQILHQDAFRSEIDSEDHSTTRGKDSTRASRESLEQLAMGMIEEIRQALLLDPIESSTSEADLPATSATAAASVVRQAAIEVGYQWRQDDGVAIYLAVARFITVNFVTADDGSITAAGASRGGGDDDTVTGREQETSSKQEHAVSAVVPGVGPSEQLSVLVAMTRIATATPLQNDKSRDHEEMLLSLPSPQHQLAHDNEREQEEHVQAVAAVATDEKQNDDEASSTQRHSPPGISFLPHVQVLPESFETSPLYYTANALARIEGTNCHGYSVRMREQIQRDWIQLHHVLQAYTRYYRQDQSDHDNATSSSSLSTHQNLILQLDLSRIVTLEAYKWALCNVYSRSSDFQITTASSATTTTAAITSATESSMLRVIAPLFDMMNHDFQSDLSHAMDQDGNISVFNGSQKSIQPGQEICLCYGNFGNEKLLFIYGFTVPENPFDVVSIFAPIPPSDPLYHVKARILQAKCGISDTNAISHSLCMSHVRQARQSILPESLLSVLRVVGFQSTDEILALAQPADDDDDDDDAESDPTSHNHQLAMISESNERGALVALHHALYSMSRRIALNLISDEGLMASSSSPLTLETVVEEETTDRGADHESTLKAAGVAVSTRVAHQTMSTAEASQLADANAQNAKNLCQAELKILIAAMSEVTERLDALDNISGDQQ